MRQCTRYLTLSFGKGMLDEIEVEAHYHFTPGTPDERADVELCKVLTVPGSFDLRPMLPDGLESKLADSILADELSGAFA